METLDEVLAHYGIRGMRWGVRTRSDHRRMTVYSPEAYRAREVKTTIKKFGVTAATNEDLKMLNERVNLEMQYNKLFPKKKSVAQKGAKMVSDILMSVGQQQAKSFLNQEAAKRIDLAVNGPIPLGKHSKKPS